MKKIFNLFIITILSMATTNLNAKDIMPFPAIKSEYVVFERMLVKEEHKEWFEDFWTNTILPVFEQYEGFEGAFMLVNSPPKGADASETDFGPLLPLGPPDKTFLPHGGIHLNGVQTDVQINLKGDLAKPDNPDFEIFFPNTSSTVTSEINYKLIDILLFV